MSNTVIQTEPAMTEDSDPAAQAAQPDQPARPEPIARAEAAEAAALAAAARARERAVRLRRQADAAHESATGEIADDEAGPEPEAPPADAGPRDSSEPPKPTEPRRRPPTAAGAAVVVATCALLGASGYMTWQHQNAVQHQLAAAAFTAAAKQGVINIMTVDYQHVEDDIRRLLDSSTGQFRDEFTSQETDFVAVAQKARTVSTGTVNSAAIESMDKNSAVVLVAATSLVTNSAGAKDDPRTWRLRVTATRDGDQIKMSKLVYVP